MKLTDPRLLQSTGIQDFLFRLRFIDADHRKYRGEAEEELRAAPVFFTAPNPEYVLGMDDSHWGGELDFKNTRGMRFAFFKCMDGTLPTKYWEINRPKAQAAGLAVSEYAWLYRNANVSCKAQALAYWNRIKAMPRMLAPVIDFEWTRYAGAQANPNYNDLDIWVTEFIRVSGIKPILYTAAGYMNPLGAMGNILKSKFSAFWFANYGVSKPALPLGFSMWDIWQFTASLDQSYYAPSSSGKLELDGNYMTQAAFARLVISPLPPVAPKAVITLAEPDGTLRTFEEK